MKRKERRSSDACEICGSPAEHRCPLCGRLVCSRHWAGDRCSLCRETTCQLCGARLAVATCPLCGRLVCEECSVQVTPVVRLCRECAAGLQGWPPKGAAEEARLLAQRLSLVLRYPPGSR